MPLQAKEFLRQPLVSLGIVVALGVGGYLPVLNFVSIYVRDELGGNLPEAALFIALMHCARTIFGAGLGLWVNRIASRRTLALGLAGMTLMLATLTASSDLLSVFAVAPFAGVAMSLHWTGLQTYLIEIAQPTRRGTVVGIIGFVLVISPGLAGVLYGIMAQELGLRALTLVATLLVGTALIGSILALPPSRPQDTSDRGRQPFRTYLRILGIPSVAPLMALRACSTLTFAAFILLAGPKLIAAGGDLRTVGVLTLIAATWAAAAQVGIGRLSDTIGRRGLLVIMLAVGGCAAAGYAISEEVPLLLALSALYSLAAWAVNTLAVSLWGDLAPGGALGQAMTLDGASYSIGNIVGALLIFALAEQSPELPFLVAGLVMIAGAPALFWVRPAHPTETLPAPSS